MKTKILLILVFFGLFSQGAMSNPIEEPFILEFSIDPPWIEVSAFASEALVGTTIRTMGGEAVILSAEPTSDYTIVFDSSNTTGFTLNPEGDSIIFSTESYQPSWKELGYGSLGPSACAPPAGTSVVGGVFETEYGVFEMGYDFCTTPAPGEWNNDIFAHNIWGASPLVINEICVNNTSESNPNYIELYNAGDSPVCTDNLLMIGNVVFDFPSELTVEPHEFLVIDDVQYPEFFDFNPSCDVLYLVYNVYDDVYSVVDQVGWSTNHGENISFMRFPDGDVDWNNWSDFMGYNDESSYTFENGSPTYGEPNSQLMDIEESILPEHIVSLYCYPNPFNAQTTISFSLEHQAHAKISIYDITGRLVEVISDAHYAGGSYSIVWNAGDLSSGIYFANMVTDGMSVTKKLVLLK